MTWKTVIFAELRLIILECWRSLSLCLIRAQDSRELYQQYISVEVCHLGIQDKTYHVL